LIPRTRAECIGIRTGIKHTHNRKSPSPSNIMHALTSPHPHFQSHSHSHSHLHLHSHTLRAVQTCTPYRTVLCRIVSYRMPYRIVHTHKQKTTKTSEGRTSLIYYMAVTGKKERKTEKKSTNTKHVCLFVSFLFCSFSVPSRSALSLCFALLSARSRSRFFEPKISLISCLFVCFAHSFFLVV